jgi:hypothetical protein
MHVGGPTQMKSSSARNRDPMMARKVHQLLLPSSLILVMWSTAPPRIILFDGGARSRTIPTGQGLFVDHLNVKTAVWLGIAVLALVWANLQIWRTRRVLSQAQHDHSVTQIGFTPTTVDELMNSAIAS